MALTSDALVVGEDFISEHYFTTDAKSQSFQAKVLERRKQWDTAKADGHATVRTRYTEARGKLTTEFIGLSESADEQTLDSLYGTLRTVLGYDNSLRWDIERIGGSDTEPGPALAVRARDLSGPAPFVLVEARGGLELEDLLAKNEKTLLREFHTEADPIASVAGLLSHLFVTEEGPRFALVLAGSTALVTERERWLEGRYLAVDLQLIGERNDDKRGGETDRALTCLEADSLAPDAEGDIWWTGVIEESVKHTVGVSKDLREGVRLSIEIIANDVVARRRAQGLDPLPDEMAQPLAGQSLRFLYRILFLLYAEATPELSVVPAGDPTYERGYSLDRLRELLPVELVTPRAQNGTHFYESLATLFDMVDRGHDGGVDDNDDARAEGLTFRRLRADLFLPSATQLIDEVKLSNAALQKVLRHLLLSKEARGKDRGFISYAELGINQLGAVYEGLMSYTGFFAHDTLYEVAKNGNTEKGTWVVPESRIADISKSDLVHTDPNQGESVPVKYERGMFVFRLAGRERQQSASYYTPEVLTRFTVGQALEELLDQDGTTTTAGEILGLTVCEPALGSGAFAIEAVRQLAEQYLMRRQNELGDRIPPEDYPTELQRVKAYLALHQVYGVDLNATAVEFAEISLWLDTMGPDLDAPWFGLHLRRGNSLIGARRAVVPGGQITNKGWIDATLVDVPLSESLDGYKGAVHHFLVPASGWGSTAEAKEGKELAPEATAALKEWRRGLKKKLTAIQVKQLRALTQRVETLWSFALRRLQIAESEIRRDIPVWGREFTPTGGAVSREQIEESLADESGAYRRLRRAMDAWCALWFWPLTDSARTVDGKIVEPPSVQDWIDALTDLLGTPVKETRSESKFGQYNLFDVSNWDELGQAEETDLLLAQAKSPNSVLEQHPWLVVADRVSSQQGFFHWELDFAPVFERGGFDLQVGNPPWVRPRSDVDALLAEADPWFKLTPSKADQDELDQRRNAALSLPGMIDLVVHETGTTGAVAAFLGDSKNYPSLSGLAPDLYRCFIELAWRNSSDRGRSGLIHMETHFTDDNAGGFREECYRRLRRHFQFINELKLFEIQNQKVYGVNVYASPRDPDFITATSLYHPDTVTRSLKHDGTGPEPGIKDESGKWDVRPHAARLLRITMKELAEWRAILNSDAPTLAVPMVFAVNKTTAKSLAQMSQSESRLGDIELRFSAGLNEKTAVKDRVIRKDWGMPQDWSHAILHGSHIYVANPFYKSPNRTMKNKDDWSDTFLEEFGEYDTPTTIYKPALSSDQHWATFPQWRYVDENRIEKIGSSSEFARAAWRTMTDNTGERTLKCALIPPRVAHFDTITSAGAPEEGTQTIVLVSAIMSALLSDFLIRNIPKSTIRAAAVKRLPSLAGKTTRTELILRALRLNCIGYSYSPVWRECYDAGMRADRWTGGFEHNRRAPLSNIDKEWTPETPLRIAADRRQALVEIDALVALGLGLTADELCTIYRTQFPVLYGYDRNKYLYDINGRLVPQEVLAVWRKKGDAISEEERTATNAAGNTYVYELPFQFLDREADMREAYAEFERRLGMKGGR